MRLFNFTVKAAAWSEGHDRILASRIFEYIDDRLANQFRNDTGPDFDALKQLPTVFVEESGIRGTEVVHVGNLVACEPRGRDILLHYQWDEMVPWLTNDHFQTFAHELGIQQAQFFRTHWSVKEGDLFKSMLRHQQPRRAMPTVFRLADLQVTEENLVTVMMPFSPAFAPVYDAIQRAATTQGMHCVRADDIWEDAAVIQDVVSLIDRAKIVVCDCTGRNANVFYETGIAHALGKEVVLLTQSAVDVPFDV